MASQKGVFSPTQSEIDGTRAARLRGASMTSEDRQTLRSERSHRSHKSHRSQRQGSVMNPAQRNSIADNGNNQASTSTNSDSITAGIPYDALSVSSKRTGVTNDSPVTGMTGNSPVTAFTSDSPLTAGANGLEQGETQPQLTAHRKSTASAFGTTSKRGSTSAQLKAHFDVAKAIFYQADSNHDGFISREEFLRWAEPGIVYPAGYEPTQSSARSQSITQQSHLSSRFPTGRTSLRPQTSTQQTDNNLLDGQDAAKEATMNIDYGAVEAYNVAMRSSVDMTGIQGPPSTNAGVSSPSTHAGVSSPSTHVGVSSSSTHAGVSSSSTVGSTHNKFDVAKAIFYQADANHDGSISRDEFREWATPGLISTTGQYSGHRASVGNASVHRNSMGNTSVPRNSIRNGSIPRSSIGHGTIPRNSSVGDFSMPRNSSVGEFPMPRNSIGNASVHRNSIRHGSVARNSVGNLSAPRNSIGNLSAPRNSVGNLSAPRNSVGNLSAPRHSIGSASNPRNSVGNISAPRHSIGNISVPRNSVGHFSTHRDSMGHFLQPRGSVGNVSNSGQMFGDDNHDAADDLQQGDFGESASNFG